MKNTNKEKTKEMSKFLSQEAEMPRLPKEGDLVEGRIIKVGKNAIIVELGPLGTGVVYGGEIKENRGLIKDIKVGEKISALVIDPENEDGYVELSFKEANLEKKWNDLREKKQESQMILSKVLEANRGGLVVNVSGIIGFLPVSQLSPVHYPRVEGGDKNKILKELSKFIGQELQVKIIDLDKKTEKLIVSEKSADKKKITESLKKYQQGDVVEGTVSALANFGAFVKLGDNLEGLAHISELDWQMINHPSEVLKENQKIKAQITDIQDGQISLSLKALQEDPWQNIKEKYQNGQIVKGKVVRFSAQGALIEIDKKIHGIAPSAEPGNIDKELETGQSYDFEIVSFNPQAHKMILSSK